MELDIDLGLFVFLTNWEKSLSSVCEKVAQSYKLSYENCMAVVSSMVPGIQKTVTRLGLQSKGDIICGYLLSICPSPHIQQMDLTPVIDALFADQPEPKEIHPVGGATFKILQFNDPHLDMKYSPGSVENVIKLSCAAEKIAFLRKARNQVQQDIGEADPEIAIFLFRHTEHSLNLLVLRSSLSLLSGSVIMRITNLMRYLKTTTLKPQSKSPKRQKPPFQKVIYSL